MWRNFSAEFLKNRETSLPQQWKEERVGTISLVFQGGFNNISYKAFRKLAMKFRGDVLLQATGRKQEARVNCQTSLLLPRGPGACTVPWQAVKYATGIIYFRHSALEVSVRHGEQPDK